MPIIQIPLLIIQILLLWALWSAHNKAAHFTQLFLVKVGSQVLPMLNTLGDGLMEFLAKSGDSIAQGITSGVQTALNALLVLGRFLYVQAPTFILGFAKSFVTGLSVVARLAPQIWTGFLGLVSNVQVGFNFLKGVVVGAFDALIEAGDRLAQSSLFQAIAKLADWIAPPAKSAGDAASAMGADQGTSAVVEVGAATLAWQGIRGLLMGGAGRGLVGRLATNPYVLAGGAIAYGGFKAAQGVGLIDEKEGFIDWNVKRAGRVWSALTTGDANNYDRNRKGDEAEQQSADLFGKMRPDIGGGPISQWVNGLKKRYAQNASNPGTWAQSLESNFGGAVRSGARGVDQFSHDSMRLLRNAEQSIGSEKNRDAIFDRLESSLKAPLQEIAKNTAKTADRTPTREDWARFGQGMFLEVQRRLIEDEFLGMTRVSR